MGKTYTDPKQNLMQNGRSRSLHVIYFGVSEKRYLANYNTIQYKL